MKHTFNEMDSATYKKYRSEEEALELIVLLKSAGIDYAVENLAPPVDITFTGGNQLEDKIAIKLSLADFERADLILRENATESIELIDKNHYLFGFSDSELIDILKNYDQWSMTDYLLAQKILEERGISISDEQLQDLKNKRIAEFSLPEKGHEGWLIFGFISAIFGGIIGILIGYHHFTFKKTIPTGEQVFAYDPETRARGKRIFTIGVVSFILWMLLSLIYIENR
ncbi:MAG: hypothetical protein ACYC1Q_10165 [Bacteroidia bacterium]